MQVILGKKSRSKDTRSRSPNITIFNVFFVFLDCQFTTYVKDSRHAETVFMLKLAETII